MDSPLLSSLILYISMNRQCFDSVRISKNILLCTGFINDHALLVSKPCEVLNVRVRVRAHTPRSPHAASSPLRVTNIQIALQLEHYPLQRLHESSHDLNRREL